MIRSTWRQLLSQAWKRTGRDQAGLVAAGVAFYALLSAPALLTTLVSLYGLLSNPHDLQGLLASLRGVVPEYALSILADQLSRIVARPPAAQSLTAVASLTFALWSGSRGLRAMMTALNVARGEPETRGFWSLNGTALALTAGGTGLMLITVTLVAVIPAAAAFTGLPALRAAGTGVTRWLILAALSLVSLAVLYRYGPARKLSGWMGISWGSTAGTLLWMGSSSAFSHFVESAGTFDATYGSLGAVVGLLLWLYISSFVVMLGAALEAVLQEKSAKRSR